MATAIQKSNQTDVLTDDIFLGRDDLVAEVVDRVVMHRHVLLTGPPGIGKSRLLKESHAILCGKSFLLDPATAHRRRRLMVTSRGRDLTALWIAEAAPQTDLLVDLIYQLHENALLAIRDPETEDWIEPALWEALCLEMSRKDVRKAYSTNRDRRAAILHSLKALHPHAILFLDSIDRASPSMASFLLQLQHVATLVTAVREVDNSPSLATFYATFGHVPVPALPNPSMHALTRYFIRTYHLQAVDPEHLTNEVLCRADGNPAALRAMLHDAAQTRLVTDDHVRALQSRDDAPFFNMGILYTFFLISGTLLRAFLTGMTDTDFYILLSLFAIVGFITFRVFRPFFTFYPTRRRQ